MKTITIKLTENEAKFLRNAAEAFVKASASFNGTSMADGTPYAPNVGAVAVWNRVRDLIDAEAQK